MKHRYDFLYLFDCQDANPNGDPDAGNLPRTDVETGQGLVTDVCLKRKIRNFVALTKKGDDKHRIFFTEGAVLNNLQKEAQEAVGIPAAESKSPKREKRDKATNWMCDHYYDIRAFGAVMSTDINCGQVRGPVQLSFARSIDPIVSSEHAITRSSVTNERDAEKERTMGRKFTDPYGLYKAQGFVNPFLAEQTVFTDDDLELLWTALENAFQFDQAAARPAGSMAPRALLVFKHEGTDSNPEQRAQQAKLGCAPSHSLFDRLQIESFEDTPAEDGKPPRKFSDYASRITFDGKPLDEVVKSGESKDLGNGITLIRRI